jgi:hypothetical protein
MRTAGSATDVSPTDEDMTMHAERALNDTAKLELPKDLVAEMSRRQTARTDDYYHVEQFKPSFFGRVAQLLTGKRR